MSGYYFTNKRYFQKGMVAMPVEEAAVDRIRMGPRRVQTKQKPNTKRNKRTSKRTNKGNMNSTEIRANKSKGNVQSVNINIGSTQRRRVNPRRRDGVLTKSVLPKTNPYGFPVVINNTFERSNQSDVRKRQDNAELEGIKEFIREARLKQLDTGGQRSVEAPLPPALPRQPQGADVNNRGPSVQDQLLAEERQFFLLKRVQEQLLEESKRRDTPLRGINNGADPRNRNETPSLDQQLDDLTPDTFALVGARLRGVEATPKGASVGQQERELEPALDSGSDFEPEPQEPEREEVNLVGDVEDVREDLGALETIQQEQEQPTPRRSSNLPPVAALATLVGNPQSALANILTKAKASPPPTPADGDIDSTLKSFLRRGKATTEETLEERYIEKKQSRSPIPKVFLSIAKQWRGRRSPDEIDEERAFNNLSLSDLSLSESEKSSLLSGGTPQPSLNEDSGGFTEDEFYSGALPPPLPPRSITFGQLPAGSLDNNLPPKRNNRP